MICWSQAYISEFKDDMKKDFEMSDLDHVSFFLGIKADMQVRY